MPLRPFSPPLASRLQKAFHTTAIRNDASAVPNHYETLQIPTNASPSEVKKYLLPFLSLHLHPQTLPRLYLVLTSNEELTD